MQVSVIMPVYNAAPFLDRAIQSALDQPQVVELIAIDDASTDGSARILEAWAEKSDRLIYLPAVSKEPQRAAAARNRGLEIASASFIAFLDADDYYLHNRFQRAQAYFKEHPEVDGLIEPVEIVYQRDYEGLTSDISIIGRSRNTLEWKWVSLSNIISNSIPITGVTLRKKVAKKVKFASDLSQTQDLDYIRKVIASGATLYMAGKNAPIVVIYRHHKNNTSSKLKEKWDKTAELEKRWIKYLSGKSIDQSVKWLLFRRYVILKFRAVQWPKWKKITLYPLLFSLEFFRMARYLL